MAAKLGHLDTLMNASPNTIDSWCCATASLNNQTKVLQWMFDENLSCFDEYTTAFAALSGSLETLSWLCSNGCPIGISSIEFGAFGGNLSILQWIQNSKLLDISHLQKQQSTACEQAVMSGNLQVLIWLRENGFQWDKWTSVRAAEGGYLDILQWSLTHGCYFSLEEVWLLAKINSRFKICDWIKITFPFSSHLFQ